MRGYALYIPEYLVLLGALLALFGERMPGRGRGATLIGSALAAAATVVAVWAVGPAPKLVGDMLTADATAAFVRATVAGLTAVFLLWLHGRGMGDERRADAAALALFSALGGMFMAMASDLVTLFMAAELSTMPAYVLIGYRRRNARSLEGALKYFLLSLLTSLVMAYGMSFVFGVSGTTAFAGFDFSRDTMLGTIGVVFTLVGLFAKMSAAPFHFWTPDAYAGAPPASVAFVSSVPKIAGMAAIVRFVAAVAPSSTSVVTFALVGAALSMVLGNLAAFPQTDIRRLMAYSGIAHTGYLLMGVAAGTEIGLASAVLYAVAYGVPSMAVMLVVAEEGPEISDLGQLASRRPWVAWSMVVYLLSLVGPWSASSGSCICSGPRSMLDTCGWSCLPCL